MAEHSEKQKMLAGELYRATGPELTGERQAAQRLLAQYNNTASDDQARRMALLRRLFGAVGENPDILPRFHCDYGYNIRVGRNCFINYNCVFLDCAPIEIGDDLQMAPAVQLYTATHPLDRQTRVVEGLEMAYPIRIGSGVWIGGGAIILPGVTIGDGAVIGAGSVVRNDVPADTLVVGNPARMIRSVA
ncbi:MAG TPA: sugar O-acetyltransferase [Stellaceae bacterium]|jgi:maltose O-acetyltransferase|nr:sugar O-acetyltransferase [Stellaceae bacterium]